MKVEIQESKNLILEKEEAIIVDVIKHLIITHLYQNILRNTIVVKNSLELINAKPLGDN
jgi:hypothetical protein